MEEKIRLLHPELTGDCSDKIIAEIKAINQLADRISDLSQEANLLSIERDKKVKLIQSMNGSVFEFIYDNPKDIPVAGKKSYVLLKNVNGGNKPW